MNDREAKFDILKILVMIMVICLHFLSHQEFLKTTNSQLYYMSWFLYGLCVVSVDVFVLITGYFTCGSTFNKASFINRITRLLLCTWFCSMLVGSFCIIFGGAELSVNNIIFSCFPTFTNTNWFITAYLLLLIVSPIVSKMISKLNQTGYRCIVLLLFLLISVFPTFSFQYRLQTKIEPGVIALFVFLYILGGYIRKYDIKIKSYLAFIIYVIVSIALLLSKVLLDYIINHSSSIYEKLGENLARQYADKFYEYSSFMVIIGAVALFLAIKNSKILSNIKLRNNVVSMLSASTLSVYVCHDQYIFRQDILWNKLVFTDGIIFDSGSLAIVLLPIMMFLTCFLIFSIFSLVHIFVVKPLILDFIMNLGFVKTLNEKIQNSKVMMKCDQVIKRI